MGKFFQQKVYFVLIIISFIIILKFHHHYIHLFASFLIFILINIFTSFLYIYIRKIKHF